MAKIETERIQGYRNGERMIDEMIEECKSFTAQVGKSSIILKFVDDLGEKRKQMYSDEFKTMKYLGFLSGIKKEIEANKENVLKTPKYGTPSETNEYFKFSTHLNDYNKDVGSNYTITDCYEVDVTAAYYQAAYLMGYISKDTYIKAATVIPKKERLWLLGAIATTYCTTTYENGEIVGEPYIHENKLLREAWKKICEYIDYVMMDVKNAIDGEFLFYWVDGIYFKGEGDTTEIFDRIRAILWRHHISFKTKPIQRIDVQTTALGLNMTLHKGDEVKKFSISRRLLKEYRGNIFKELCEKENNIVLLEYAKMQSKIK